MLHIEIHKINIQSIFIACTLHTLIYSFCRTTQRRREILTIGHIPWFVDSQSKSQWAWLQSTHWNYHALSRRIAAINSFYTVLPLAVTCVQISIVFRTFCLFTWINFVAFYFDIFSWTITMKLPKSQRLIKYNLKLFAPQSIEWAHVFMRSNTYDIQYYDFLTKNK